MLFVASVLFGLIMACKLLEGWQWFDPQPYARRNSLLKRFTVNVETRRRGWAAAAFFGRSGLRWAAATGIAIFLIALVIAWIDFWADADEPGFDRRLRAFLQDRAFQVLAGAAIGALGFHVLRTIYRAKNDYIGWLIASFGVVSLVVVMLLTELNYGLISRLSRFDVAGASLQFNPRGQPATGVASYTLDNKPRAAAAGVERVQRAILRARDLAGYISVERALRSFFGDTDGARAEALSLDERFVLQVVNPTLDILESIHAAQPSDDISISLPANVIDGLRAYVNVSASATSPPREEVHRELHAAWADFTGRLVAFLNDQICQRARDVRSTLAGKCASRAREIVAVATRPGFVSGKARVFDERSPFGVALSAIVLVASGQPEAALSDVRRWTVRSHTATLTSAGPVEVIPLLRGMLIEIQLMQDENVGRDARSSDLYRFNLRSLGVLQRLVRDERATAFRPLAPDVMSSGGSPAIVPPELCLRIVNLPHLQSLYANYAILLNNIVYFGAARSLDVDRHADEEFGADQRTWDLQLPALEALRLDCLVGDRQRATYESAFANTAYRAHMARFNLALADGAGDRQKRHLCGALAAAQRHRSAVRLRSGTTASGSPDPEVIDDRARADRNIAEVRSRLAHFGASAPC